MTHRYTSFGVSPSSAYDQAYQRSPEHDAMQVAVYHWAERADEWNTVRLAEKGACERKWVIAEFDLKVDDAIIGFVDIAVIYVRSATKDTGEHRHYRLLEIKPRIDSVGGIIRQCKVIKHRAHVTAKNAQNRKASWSYADSFSIEVIPVVPANDPSRNDLRSMCPYKLLAWDMEAGVPEFARMLPA